MIITSKIITIKGCKWQKKAAWRIAIIINI